MNKEEKTETKKMIQQKSAKQKHRQDIAFPEVLCLEMLNQKISKHEFFKNCNTDCIIL